jgi:hypothetical protein
MLDDVGVHLRATGGGKLDLCTLFSLSVGNSWPSAVARKASDNTHTVWAVGTQIRIAPCSRFPQV